MIRSIVRISLQNYTARLRLSYVFQGATNQEEHAKFQARRILVEQRQIRRRCAFRFSGKVPNFRTDRKKRGVCDPSLRRRTSNFRKQTFPVCDFVRTGILSLEFPALFCSQLYFLFSFCNISNVVQKNLLHTGSFLSILLSIEKQRRLQFPVVYNFQNPCSSRRISIDYT